MRIWMKKETAFGDSAGQINDLAELADVFLELEAGHSVTLVANDDGSTSVFRTRKFNSRAKDRRPVLIFGTSGSMGLPKLISRSWEELKKEIRRSPAWTWGSPFKPWSYAGVQVALQAWAMGGRIFSLPTRPSAAAALLAGNAIHALSCTPTFLDLLMEWESGCSSKCQDSRRLSQITLGGEPVRPAFGRRVLEFFPSSHVTSIYATSELGVLLKANRLDGWHDAEFLNSRCKAWRIRSGILEVFSEGQWRTTGDLVATKHEGERSLLRVLGRADAIANVGGTKISLAGIGALAESVAGVRRATAFALPSPVTGQIVALKYSPEAKVDLEDLRRRVEGTLRSRLAKPAWPRAWIVGKIEPEKNGKRAVRNVRRLSVESLREA